MMRTIKIEVLECTCERCGHVWVPRPQQEGKHWVTPRPIACSKCKSPYWDRARKKAK